MSGQNLQPRHAEEALQALVGLEQAVIANQHTLQRQRNKANFIVKTVLVVLGCLALLNVHFMHVLTQEFRTMVKDMVAMYEHFGRVADRMDSMTTHVEDMRQNIQLMPVMEAQMQAMSGSIHAMQANMSGMTTDVTLMEQRIGAINQDVGVMSQHFRRMNVHVAGMQRHVAAISEVVP